MKEESPKVTGYAIYALVLLTLVYVLNFLDRTLIYILFAPIKKEFALSDTQLALLGTTAFVIFYTVLGIPFGRMADKGSRKNLIAIGLAVWSLFSGLTGFATDFWTLFFCRLMVGVGEATLGPAALSLLSDYFPPRYRATVSSIYSMGIAVGAGLAAFLGGYLGQNYGWRTAFFALGFPGLFLAVLVYFLRENKRDSFAVSVDEIGANQTAKADWRVLLSSSPFIFLCVGYALLGLATNNLSIWGATFFNRVNGFDLQQIGFWGGVLTIFAGIPSTLLGGVLADYFGRKRRGGRFFYSSFLALFSAPVWVLLIFSTDVYFIIAANFLLLFAALAWLGAAAADAQEIAGVKLRGVAIAIYILSVNFAAYLFGSNLIGLLNDYLGATANPEMMRYALLVCPIACVLSAVCLFLGGRSLEKSRPML